MMDSPPHKVDQRLQDRLSGLAPDAFVDIEIFPLQNRWRHLLRHLRDATERGVEYNVVDLTSISATVPGWLVPGIAERPDVVWIQLSRDEQ